MIMEFIDYFSLMTLGLPHEYTDHPAAPSLGKEQFVAPLMSQAVNIQPSDDFRTQWFRPQNGRKKWNNMWNHVELVARVT